VKLSRGGKIVLAQVEACVLVPYQDGKHLSIGFGHNSPELTVSHKITVKQAFELLAIDLVPREERVQSLLKGIVSQNQFDALVLLHYQSGNRYLPAAAHLVNYKEWGLIEEMWPLMAYDAQGVFMPGLQKRRRRELAIFSQAEYGPIWEPIKLWKGDPRKTKPEPYTIQPGDID
jgi:GH24 family phage-related lysozyme (muramidase)